ncbi:MAG: insulinase family protein, partial [Lachnospiraceae bacterium]|nr:insulinase family protein [Lachnospiraceae bacterium]
CFLLTGCESASIDGLHNTANLIHSTAEAIRGSESLRSEASDRYALPAVGDLRHGFTVTERGSIDYLRAETAAFVHEKSGLTLFLIENEDPELAFQIAYRVPQKDETDIPHIFEHAILAGSDKYPGTNVFFDLDNKSYHTFINASTSQCMTRYQFASVSEEQLLNTLDVYMSCMEAPVVLSDKRIFEREAVRYQLYDRDAPIEMTGTVFSEDLGKMTGIGNQLWRAGFREMYTDPIASNAVGRLYENYDQLSYEKLQEVYDTYYSYDNAIIVLYGRLDYDRELAFLDEHYLRDEARQGKNALSEVALVPKEGLQRAEVLVPAYESDSAQGQSMAAYLIDLSEFSVEERLALSFFTSFLGSGSDSLQERLKKAGINNPVVIDNAAFDGAVRSGFGFMLYNAKPGQEEALYDAAREALSKVAENGFEPSVIESALHNTAMLEDMSLEGADIGIYEPVQFLSCFMTTGRTDYYTLWQQAYDEIRNDPGQRLLKSLAKKLLSAKASCLVTAAPAPGLAEELLEKREAYLTEKKAGMTEAEIDQLIEDTRAFDEWNENPVHNSDFLIDPRDFPKPEKLPEPIVQ